MLTMPAAAPPASHVDKATWVGLILALVLGPLVLTLPLPGVSLVAQRVVAITVFAVVLWIFHVMNNGFVSILMMGLLIVAGVRAPLVLSGFASPSWWILLCVVYYGFAMERTGLARRIAFYILSLFPATYVGIIVAFFVIGLVLAFGIPSMTVRTAVLVPIAWALVKSIGLEPRSRGSALIMLTVIEMAVLPGLAVLLGSLNGPIVIAVFQSRGLPLSWLSYAQVMSVPTLLMCALLILANLLLLRPESKLHLSNTFIRGELEALGAITRPELITSAVVLLSIAFWATDRYHHLPTFLIGMFALAVFSFAGIIREREVGTGVSWTLLLFLGGIFGLSNVFEEYKIADFLATMILPIMTQLTFSAVAFLVVMAIVMTVLRSVEPSSFISIPVLFLAVVPLSTSVAIPPLVLMAPLLLASTPFWASYQNFWIAMGEGMTNGEAFSAGQRVRIATAYFVVVLITVALSVGYWRTIGIL